LNTQIKDDRIAEIRFTPGLLTLVRMVALPSMAADFDPVIISDVGTYQVPIDELRHEIDVERQKLSEQMLQFEE